MLPTQSCAWDYRVMWLDPPSEWCEWTPDNVTFRALKKRNISTTTHFHQILYSECLSLWQWKYAVSTSPCVQSKTPLRLVNVCSAALRYQRRKKLNIGYKLEVKNWLTPFINPYVLTRHYCTASSVIYKYVKCISSLISNNLEMIWNNWNNE